MLVMMMMIMRRGVAVLRTVSTVQLMSPVLRVVTLMVVLWKVVALVVLLRLQQQQLLLLPRQLRSNRARWMSSVFKHLKETEHCSFQHPTQTMLFRGQNVRQQMWGNKSVKSRKITLNPQGNFTHFSLANDCRVHRTPFIFLWPFDGKFLF